MASLKPELLKLCGLTISGVAFALCGDIKGAKSTGVEIVEALAPNFAHQFLSGMDYIKFKEFLLKPHPNNLNHDLERLMKDALVQAFHHMETLYLDKIQNEEQHSFWDKILKRPFTETKQVFKQLRQNLIREEDYQNEFKDKLPESEKIVFQLSENLKIDEWKDSSKLLDELFKIPENKDPEEWKLLRKYFDDNLPKIYDLAFKEALKDERNIKAFKAFQIYALETITAQNNLSHEKLDQLNNTIDTIKSEIQNGLSKKAYIVLEKGVESLTNQLNIGFKVVIENIKQLEYNISNKIEESEAKQSEKINKRFDKLEQIFKDNDISEIYNQLKNTTSERKTNKFQKPQLGSIYSGEILGRDNQLQELFNYFQKPGNRLMCINGIGGIGKTRLAYEFTNKHKSIYTGGYWFVKLMDCETEPEFQAKVLETISFIENIPQSYYKDYLPTIFEDDKMYLIVLDNFEQLVNKAEKTLDYWINNTSENVKFLITSTHSLNTDLDFEYIGLEGIDGNLELVENSLSLIFQNIRKKPIAQQRIEELKSERECLKKIVQYLQGIPLAIEIVAAQLVFTSPQTVLNQIEKILDYHNSKTSKPTHLTLRKTVEWSFNLLPKEHQMFLVQLATFRDGFDLHAVENIIKSNDVEHEEHLKFLISNSLIYVENYLRWSRFKLLNVILKFCINKYNEMPESIKQQLLEEKRNYYLKYAEKYISRLSTDRGVESAEIILREKENYFLVQDDLINAGQIEESGEFIISIAKVLELKAPTNLRIERLLKSFELIIEDSLIKMKLAFELSQAYLASGDWNKAIDLIIISLNLSKTFGDNNDKAKIYRSLSTFYFERGQPKRGEEFGLKAKFYNEFGSNDGVFNTNLLDSLAYVQAKFINFNAGIKQLKIIETILIDRGDNFQLMIHYNRVALVYYFKGDINQAVNYLEKAYQIVKSSKINGWIPAIETNLALMYSEAGNLKEALNLFELAEMEQLEMGRLHWQAVNYGGWGRTLLMLPEYESDIQIQNKTLDYIGKAIIASEKVFYPENLTMHIGDIARAHFKKGNFKEAFQNAMKAVSYEYKIMTNMGKRHYSNLTILACSAFEIGYNDKFYEAFEKISQIRKTDDYQIFQSLPKILEDNFLIEKYKVKFNFNIRKNLIKYFEQKNISVNSRKWATKKLSDLCGSTRYEHPWYFLKEDLIKRNESSILLFGYGSLLNSKSANRTLSQNIINNGIHAISFGTRRIFNYQMTTKVSSRDVYNGIGFPENYSCLNIFVTGFVSDFCNGIIYEIPIDEIDALCEREDGYDLIEVPCLTWSNKTPIDKKVYVLAAEERYKNNRKLINNDIDPHPDYLITCKEGALEHGQDFSDFWHQTTYLSNGIDLLSD